MDRAERSEPVFVIEPVRSKIVGPPHPLDKKWFLHLDREIFGPYTGHELKDFALEGRIDKNTDTLKEGSDDWTKAFHDPQLASIFFAKNIGISEAKKIFMKKTTVTIDGPGWGSPGVLAGLLGCVFGVLGILTIGFVFFPLAVLCSVVGLFRGLFAFSASGILISLLGGLLSIAAFVFSPLMWVFVLGILSGIGTHYQ